MGKVSCVAAAQGSAWCTVSRSWSWITGTILWLNHIQFCWAPCNHHESSFCLFMRHSSVSLWARCQLGALNPCPRPWLHIYSGMHADNLSCRVNTPPDFCLFAHIWKTDGMEKKKCYRVTMCQTECPYFLQFRHHSISHFSFFIQRCFFISGISTKGFLVTSDNPLLSQFHTGGMTQRCWVSL